MAIRPRPCYQRRRGTHVRSAHARRQTARLAGADRRRAAKRVRLLAACAFPPRRSGSSRQTGKRRISVGRFHIRDTMQLFSKFLPTLATNTSTNARRQRRKETRIHLSFLISIDIDFLICLIQIQSPLVAALPESREGRRPPQPVNNQMSRITFLLVALLVRVQPLSITQHTALMDVYNGLGTSLPALPSPFALKICVFSPLFCFCQDATPPCVLDSPHQRTVLA